MKSTLKNRTIFTRDNLEVMRGMADECIDLIYLDPPFNSNHDYSAPIGSQAAGAEFKDTWGLSDIDLAWYGEIEDEYPGLYSLLTATREIHGKSMMAYLIYMSVRIIEMKRILKPDGSIYLHCDPTASHYLKLMMDEVFGRKCFRREVIWSNEDQSGFKSKANNWIRGHDVIFYYVKSLGSQIFNKEYSPLDPKTIKRYDKKEPDGRRYKIYKNKDGSERKSYLKKDRGAAIGSVWTSIASFQKVNNTGEYLKYPTQKPLALLERMIKASSNEGGMVFDPFCGCATACVAAEKLDRQWVGIDVSEKAAELVQTRIKKELGILLFKLNHRTDIPTDRKGERSRDIKNILYGKQEGNCAGCNHHFRLRNLTIDHIIPKSKGGGDVDENLQLLCGYCNSLKGDKTQEYLISRLKQENALAG